MNAATPPGEESGAQVVPTCFRHPDRETYVRCTRCNRPICPDCMREAAVGFHCVDCVAEGGRSVRQARTVFGGRVIGRPYVSFTLLGLMVAGFVLQLATDGSSGAGATSLFAMWGPGVYHGEWYRLVTAAFLHGGVMHLLFNGYAMYIVGPQLEQWLGHVRFAALWVLSAIGGSVLTYVLDPAQSSVGASGAVFGLFGAVFVIGRRLQLDTRFIVALLAVNLVITFLFPAISWTAHVGGLITGLLLGAAYAYLPQGAASGQRAARTRTLLHTAVTAVVAVLLVAAVAANTAALGAV
ncbi:membrane associated rhomboid family serine protease [Murinocardiopsis flavida]|uniref:Membrane associated rhomboid family serine protease n=1 Tax=Murinocardiopsis flavida TaxID=645275 RepID=A0A2P8DQ23_9ACTN|nr:rhomboid family intramembrane serine protease [Murinocardiopsis flavida]PSK99329.1 membrane associated rhomboid family serine protease [Murinocardiopsis flavida]